MILQQLERRAARRTAFTLMEVLVVVAILVILAGAASIAVFRYLDEAKKDRARMDIQTLHTTVKSYTLKNQGQFPERLEDILHLIEGGSTSAITDPWGQPYRYAVTEINGQQTAVISAVAPDGEEISNIKP